MLAHPAVKIPHGAATRVRSGGTAIFNRYAGVSEVPAITGIMAGAQPEWNHDIFWQARTV